MISETTSLLAHKMRKLHSQSSDPAAMAENIRLLMEAERQAWASRYHGDTAGESATLPFGHSKPTLVRHN
jgi:hypothetical protein